MTAQPDYYKIFGLARTASSEEIKKRYRELARRFHPDVNPSPDAAQKIKLINEAYHVIGDSERRAVYDANTVLKGPQKSSGGPAAGNGRRSSSSAPRQSPSASPPSPSQSRSTRPSSGPGGQRPSSDRSWDFDGFGRRSSEADSRPRSGRPPQQPRSSERDPSAEKPPRERSANPSGAAVQNLVSEAQLAFINRKYDQAEALCQEALKLDRRNAVVYEILGDIYSRRGQTEGASAAYSYAIQFNPRNYSVHGKLDRLSGRSEVSSRGPTMGTPSRVPRSAADKLGVGAKRDVVITMISALMVLAFVGVFAAYRANPGEPLAAGVPWIPSLSGTMIVALLCNGWIAGVLLAFYGGMRPVSEELVPRDGIGRSTAGGVPAIYILAVSSLVWFYISMAVYVGIGAMQNRFSRSLLRLYALTGALIVISTYVASQVSGGALTITTIAFAGNLLFPAAMTGWYFGDTIRLQKR